MVELPGLNLLNQDFDPDRFSIDLQTPLGTRALVELTDRLIQPLLLGAGGGDRDFDHLSGVATVELGDGTPPLPGVPFSVTITTGGSVVLALDSTALPPAAIGGITVN